MFGNSGEYSNKINSYELEQLTLWEFLAISNFQSNRIYMVSRTGQFLNDSTNLVEKSISSTLEI